jgi:hypothetical protein
MCKHNLDLLSLFKTTFTATLSGLTVYYKRRPSEIDEVGECENGIAVFK